MRIAFYRANPKYGSVGNREVKESTKLPGILETTISLETLTLWLGPDFQGDGTFSKTL